MFFLFLFFYLCVITILLYNVFNRITLKTQHTGTKGVNAQLLSILIPVRNEEHNIINCLQSLLVQTYTQYEILILDDGSVDNTVQLIQGFLKQNPLYEDRVRLLTGKQLPPLWTGKNWACWQLAQMARGDYLLFVDADTRFAQDALSQAMTTVHVYNAQLLSIFPTQVMKSFGEYLIVPLMDIILLCFLPLKQIFVSKRPQLSGANGQFMLFEKNSYFAVGGHEAVQDEIVEDLALARLYKRNHLKVLGVLGEGAVSCRMYTSFKEAFNGFGKNFYRGTGMSAFAFLTVLLFIGAMFGAPFVVAFIDAKYLIFVACIFLMRLLICMLSRNSFLTLLLHPLQTIMLLLLGFYSWYGTIKGSHQWKGRKV